MASEEIAERIEMAATKPSASTESESRGERAEQGDIAQDESSSRTSVPTGGAESPMTARKVLRIEDGTYDATDSFWIKVGVVDKESSNALDHFPSGQPHDECEADSQEGRHRRRRRRATRRRKGRHRRCSAVRTKGILS